MEGVSVNLALKKQNGNPYLDRVIPILHRRCAEAAGDLILVVSLLAKYLMSNTNRNQESNLNGSFIFADFLKEIL